MLEFNTTLLVQIVNFIILLIFLRLVAYKPIAGLLKARQELIANNIATSEEQRKQAEELHEQYLAEMRKAREEAQAILAQATKVSEGQAKEIIAAAKEEANRVKDGALKEIEREKEKAVRELKDQVAVLSVMVAGKIIGKTMTADIQHDMVEQFIREAGDLPC